MDARPRRPTPAEVAWLCVLPYAALTIVAVLLLGPPLGHLLFAPGGDRLWPPGWWETMGRPEPVKQGRVLVATLAPALLVAAILTSTRTRVRVSPVKARALVTLAAGAVVALAVVSLLAQHPLLTPERPAPDLFGPGAVLVAALLAGAVVLLLRQRAAVARLTTLMRDTKVRRVVGLAIASAFAAAWLLRAVTTDGLAGDVTGMNLPWTFDDAIAVLDGRTPLVDYHMIYGKLVPYGSALALGLFGTTILVYTAFMAVLNWAVLVAVYGIFRRATRSSLLALALFLPFVAISDVNPGENPQGFGSPFTLSAMWPMRYGGAFLLAWLTARHIDGGRPRRRAGIFFVAGLVAINNLEFGVGAVVATFLTLLCARRPTSPRDAAKLLVPAAGGMLAATALVALLTLIRAGELPDFGMVLEWPRIFTKLGWFSMPLPAWDLHLGIYATFVAAVAVAAVRIKTTAAEDGAVLTGMLVWSGVFGLMIVSYYAGRPDVIKLTGMLSAWGFALAMLTIVSVRALVGERGDHPAAVAVHALVLFAFALMATALTNTPQPQRELRRLTAPSGGMIYLPTAERFVREHSHRGEKVAILVPMGNRIAHELGLANVSPYSFMNAIVTRSQLQTLLRAVRRERVREVFTPAPGSVLVQEGEAALDQVEAIVASGFELDDEYAGMIEFRRRR